MAGFICPTVFMVTTSHATGLEKTLLPTVKPTVKFPAYQIFYSEVLYTLADSHPISIWFFL